MARSYPGVSALKAASNDLYVGGSFKSAGGAANYIVRYNTADDSWAALGSGVNGKVLAITGTPEGRYLGGEFRQAGQYTPQNSTPRAVPAGQSVVRAFRLEAKSAGGQPVTQFAQAYTMQVSYDDQLLAAAGVQDPSTLTLAYWNGSGWVSMFPCQSCGVDTTNKVITVVANHFTEFALLGKSNAQHSFIPIIIQK